MSPEQREAFKAAILALRSYQYGNAAPALAEETADHCAQVLAADEAREATESNLVFSPREYFIEYGPGAGEYLVLSVAQGGHFGQPAFWRITRWYPLGSPTRCEILAYDLKWKPWNQRDVIIPVWQFEDACKAVETIVPTLLGEAKGAAL